MRALCCMRVERESNGWGTNQREVNVVCGMEAEEEDEG